jgi:DNA repair protein RadC
MDPSPPYPSEHTAYPDIPLTVKELPPEMRPREEFLRSGARNVPLDVLLAILLRTGVPGMNVSELARFLLKQFQGIDSLCETSYAHLRSLNIKGLGPVKCMELAAALELGRRAMEDQKQRELRGDTPSLSTPENVYRLLAPLARGLRQEIFWAVLLNTKGRLIGQPVETSRGQLDASLIHPREVFTKAIHYSAASVILAHNHPSGDPAPSKEDLVITRRLVEAARILGIRVVDHLIVGTPSATSPGDVSLRSNGLADFD